MRQLLLDLKSTPGVRVCKARLNTVIHNQNMMQSAIICFSSVTALASHCTNMSSYYSRDTSSL